MAIFDAPTRETCSVVRNATNTPLQALVVMNETQFVEAAAALGQRMITEGGISPASRLTYGFRLVTGRSPTTEEVSLLASALERHLQRLSDESTSYTLIGSTLINLDEFINRP
jgi:hypothetical protein